MDDYFSHNITKAALGIPLDNNFIVLDNGIGFVRHARRPRRRLLATRAPAQTHPSSDDAPSHLSDATPSLPSDGASARL
jgi:hypothetical protein